MKKKVIKIDGQFVATVTPQSLVMCKHVKDALDVSNFNWEQIVFIFNNLKQNKSVTEYKIVEVAK